MAIQSEKIKQYEKIAENKHKIKRMKPKEEKKEEVPLPEFILHKMKSLDEAPVNFPKLNDKVVFFP